ncbi:MAG: hypothetical protein P4L63_02115 [Candidatus Pacebacteria bacterium]|nr:hypothetical protein [Candidatus Paceibacterota bacterium]
MKTPEVNFSKKESNVNKYRNDPLKDSYAERLRCYVELHNTTAAQLESAVKDGAVSEVPTDLFDHLDVGVFLDKYGIQKGKIENKFSEKDLLDAINRAFNKKCRERAKELGKDILSEEEKRKVRFTISDYNFLKEEGDPSDRVLIKRLGKQFGPSWSDVFKKIDFSSD